MRSMMMAAALVACAGFAAPAMAQSNAAQAPGTVLSVNASGVSAARPDLATMVVGVETRGATAQDAIAQNAERMTAVIAALRRAGVAERDIQTAWVRVDARTESRGSGGASVIVGYQATNTVRAEVRNINTTGRVIDAVVAAGGNQVHGVQFSRQDVEAQLDLARNNAIERARERAQLYARALGMRVERVISVTEAGAAPAAFGGDEIIVTGSRVGGGDYVTPVAPGEVETRANVSVSFLLR